MRCYRKRGPTAASPRTRTTTRLYIYVCVCICVCVYDYKLLVCTELCKFIICAAAVSQLFSHRLLLLLVKSNWIPLRLQDNKPGWCGWATLALWPASVCNISWVRPPCCAQSSKRCQLLPRPSVRALERYEPSSEMQNWIFMLSAIYFEEIEKKLFLIFA